MTLACAGFGVESAAGVAVGNAFVLSRGPICVTPGWVTGNEVEAEVGRFEAAVHLASEQLQEIRNMVQHVHGISVDR